MYELHVDRLDVAVRALWHLAKRQQWGLAKELGIEQEELEYAYEVASLRFAKPYTDEQVFYFLSLSPSLFPAALEALRRYEQTFASERAAFHEGLRRLLSLPHSRRGRHRSSHAV